MDNDNEVPKLTLDAITPKHRADARSDCLATIDQVRDEIVKGRFMGVRVTALLPSGGLVTRVCGIMPVEHSGLAQTTPLGKLIDELKGAQN